MVGEKDGENKRGVQSMKSKGREGGMISRKNRKRQK